MCIVLHIYLYIILVYFFRHFFHMCINIYVYILYTMVCPTIFIQSHDDCRDRGEDASTNEAWQRPAALSALGRAVRMDLKKSMALWLRASMLDTQRRWQMSSRCRVGVGVAWISHVPSKLNFWLSATTPGLGNQEADIRSLE